MFSETMQDCHAVVTGGSAGIGAAIAVRLARAGARVTIIGRNIERLEHVAAELQQYGAAAGWHAAELTDAMAVKTAFDAAAAHRGPANLLINNAGGVESAPFEKTTEALLERMLAINLKQAVYCIQAVLPKLKEAPFGRIVNVASTAGLTGYPYASAYCVAKHALVGLTRALALELAQTRVTVNAVCPGYTDTELLERVVSRISERSSRDSSTIKAGFAATNPAKRLVNPAEVADAVAWLCGKDASAITGQAIVVANGEVLH